MAKETLNGPNGISLVLDSTQIFPDDPGNGTPAMVYQKGHSATYWCALDTGELDCGEFELGISEGQWLDEQENKVSEFLERHSA